MSLKNFISYEDAEEIFGEYAGEINQLKSGLTNVDVALSVPDGTGKNILPMTVSGIKAYNTDGTWSGNDYTLNNVVFTILTDSDGYVTGIKANGTASARSDFNLVTPGIYVKGGSYKLNGCPADGSSSKYRIQVWNFTQNTGYNDYGSGADAAVNTGDNMGYQITVYSNYTASNLTFYPMLRPATITDPTFAPYIPSVDARLDAVESGLTNQTARSISNITSRLTNLTTAVAEQNLEKYGYKIGDYFTGASGYIYYLADMDTFYGGYNNNAIVSTHHISLVVKTGANSKWAETNDTSGGYKTSTLHSYLSSTVLDNIKSDMIALFGGSTGLEHLVSHKLLWTTATSAWAWSDNAEYISALSEIQVYGTNVWAIDGYQTGEAWKWLEIFHKFNFCDIIGNIWLWLRSISSDSNACYAHYTGFANYDEASDSNGAVGLIIFH